MSSPEELREKIAELWKQSRPIMRRRLDALEKAQRALETGTLDKADREEAVRQAHNLAGSLGMFGFAEGSRCASAIEQMLQNERPSLAKLATLLQELQRAIS